ncbi:hypothetical protein ES703_101485 [subsurface metagenome]
MGVIDLTEMLGVLEADGNVRCSKCIDQIEDYWTKSFSSKDDEVLTASDIEDGEKIYICDYCNEKL